MAELQVESIDWHLVAHGQNSHGGEVAGRVDDIAIGRHARQAEGGCWKTASESVFTLSEGRVAQSALPSFTREGTTTLLQVA